MKNEDVNHISKLEMLKALKAGKKIARYDDGSHEFYILDENVLKDEHGRTLSNDMSEYFSNAPNSGWIVK